MDIKKHIQMAMAYADVTEAELARRMGYASQQALHKRLRTARFSQQDLDRIAEALGCTFNFEFIFPDGTKT